MKVSAVRTKTLSAISADALDAAIASFVITLGEGQLITIEFEVFRSGDVTSVTYAAMIIYTS